VTCGPYDRCVTRSRFVLLVLLLAVVRAQAQEEQVEEVGKPYWVSTPAGAGAALRRAISAFANRDSAGAATALHDVFRNHADQFAKTGLRGSYVGARARAVELLARMDDVRPEYERRFGPEAEQGLREALASNDRRGLIAVVRSYEGTRAGLRAILALADSALLRGRPAEARLLLRRLARLHPDAAASKGVLDRAALAAARDHAQGGPPPKGSEKTPNARRFPQLDDHAWPMLAGNASRSRINEAPLYRDEAYVVDRLDITERMWDHPPQPRQSYHLGRGSSYRADWLERWGEYVPVHPVIARGYFVYHNGTSLEAVNLYQGRNEEGQPHWRYPERTDVESDGRTNLSLLFAPVIADGIVYAALEVPTDYSPQTLQTVPITYYLPVRRMVAIDLETGDVVWSHEEAPDPRDPLLKRLSISGAPLVRGDRIYVGATESKGTFHNYMLALDRRTGRLIYATRVSNGQQELNLFGRQLQEAAGTPVAEADGVLYYGTNQGIFVALDALLGTPRWATSYPVETIPFTFLWYEAPRRWPRIDNGPPIVVGDTILVAPADGTHMLALHRASGRVKWKVRYAQPQGGPGLRPRILQGADDKQVYVSGSKGIAALSREDGSVRWIQQFPREGDFGAGRGILAEDGLWIPTFKAVYRFDTKTGKTTLEEIREGSDEQAVVNLVWGDGVLLTAGREHIVGRYDAADVIRRARAHIKEHPDEIAPILVAADIYLATDRIGLALEYYKRARARAHARGVPAAARRAQDGLYRARLKRADEAIESDPDRASAEFEAAFAAAPTDQARLRGRLRLEGRLAMEGGPFNDWRLRNLRALAREYGENRFDEAGRTIRGLALREMALILLERKQTKQALAVLHKLVESDPYGADGRHAATEIRSILEQEGREYYQPYEKRAQRVFRSALQSGDLEALERGLHIYAHADAAGEATLELARRRLAAGDPTSAANALQRFLAGRPEAPEVPRALVMVVRAMHERHSFGPAFSALQRLKRQHGDALVLRADGARVPAREIADEWLKRSPYPTIAKSARRRDLAGDLVLRFERNFPRGAFVDVPDLLGQRPPALREAVVLKSGSTLTVLDARTGEQVYTIDFGEYEPRGPLVLAGRRLLAVTERHVHVCDAETGKTLARELVPDRGKGLSLLEHQGQVFLIFAQRAMSGRVSVAALHPEDGRAIWTSAIETDGAYERVLPRHAVGQGGRLVLFSERPVRMTVVNTTSGAIESRVLVDSSAITRFAAVRPQVFADGRILIGLLTRTRTDGFAWEHSYAVHLLDPTQRTARVNVWPPYSPSRDGKNRYLSLLHVVGNHIVALDDACGAAVLDLREGTRVKWEPRLPIEGDIDGRAELTTKQPRHDSLLLVTTRGRNRIPAHLSAFEVPSLQRKYSVAIADHGRETAEVIESQGVLGISLMPSGRRNTGARIRLFDPLTAAQLMEIVPGDRTIRWFTAKVQNGILIVSPGGQAAYGYGPK